MNLLVQDLSISYGKRNILRGVSLSFSAGLHLLAGLNGSGKSSLLHAMLQAVPYSGSISLDGKNLKTFTPRQRAQQIALVAQQVSLPFPVTAIEFVRMGRFPHLGALSAWSTSDTAAAEAALDRVNATAFAHRQVNELSGGEQQKVFIAAALCQAAPVLLLDEPDHALDPLNVQQLQQLLTDLATDGKLILCATHSAPLLGMPCQSVTGLRNGEVVLHGSAVSRSELEQEVFGMKA